MARIVINAGHTKVNPGTGAIKYLNESIETRKIAYQLMSLLAETNHEVIPAVFDRSNGNIKEAVDLSNKKNAELFISIHLNAGGGKGVEVFTWNGSKTPLAEEICKSLAPVCNGNRGVKNGSMLYVIKNTKCPAVLIECGFVDDKEFANRYNSNEVALNIFNAIKRVYK